MKKPSKDAMKTMMAVLFLAAMGFFILVGFMIHRVLGFFLIGAFCLFLSIAIHEALREKKKDQ